MGLAFEYGRPLFTGELKEPDMPFDVALLMELLIWFKHKFFTWVDQPTCDSCGGRTIFTNTMAVTTERETCRMEVSVRTTGLLEEADYDEYIYFFSLN